MPQRVPSISSIAACGLHALGWDETRREEQEDELELVEEPAGMATAAIENSEAMAGDAIATSEGIATPATEAPVAPIARKGSAAAVDGGG